MFMAQTEIHVQRVLDRIASTVAQCGRKIEEIRDVGSAVQDLNTCKVNLRRISPSVSSNIVQTIDTAINDLLLIASSRGQHGLLSAVASGPSSSSSSALPSAATHSGFFLFYNNSLTIFVLHLLLNTLACHCSLTKIYYSTCLESESC